MSVTPVASPETARQAAVTMALSTVFFFFMATAVRLAEGIPALELVFFRAWVSLLLAGLQCWFEGVDPRGTQRALLVGRGVLGTFALIGYFVSLTTLPLATATVLQGLAPVFATALAVGLLGERLRPVQVGLFALAGAGVLLVQGADTASDPWGVAVGVAGAACSAGAYTTIAAMGTREPPLVVVFWFPLVTVPIVAPVLPWVWVWPDAGQWVALVATGVFVHVAQLLMTRAYQLGPTGVVSLVSYLGVAWAALGGWALFGETPTARAALGLVAILVAVVGTTLVRPGSR